jgi:hypothetical protein
LAGRTVALGCRGGRTEIRCDNHCDEHEASADTQAKRGCFPTHDAPSRLMSLSRPIRRPQTFRGLSLDAIFFFLGIHDNKVLL